MFIETETDRLQLLKSLGEEVDVDGRKLWGVFDFSFNEIAFDSPVEGLRPQVMVLSSDATDIERGVTVVRGGKFYSVVTVEPDGFGMTFLKLNEA